MKISAYILSAFAFAVTTAAVAAEDKLIVSAGEHDTYSRVVFDRGASNTTIERDGRVVRFHNIDQSIVFDFQNINLRRKAYRVLSAKRVSSATGDIIELNLNCDCDIRTSQLQSGKFVLDVVTPSAAANEKINTPGGERPKPSANAIKDAATDEDLLSVEQARNRMVALLNQAADDGLVTIRNKPDPAPRNGQSSAPTQLVSPHKTPPGNSAPEKRPESQNLAQNETERPAASDKEYRCFANPAFHIAGEDFEAEPLVQIAELQMQLADVEAMQEDNVMRKLASGYLSIGFGEEALALLIDYGAEESIYAEIARIVAERPIGANSKILNAKHCSGAHALWQAVASAPENALNYFEKSDGSIRALPRRLKVMIATRLAIKMINAEAWAAAEKLYEIANAEMETPNSELEYISARINGHGDGGDVTRDALLEIASQNSDASKDALLALAESYAQNGTEPYEGFKEDIGALAKIGGFSEAAFAEAAAWANVGNIDAAMMLLQNEAGKSPERLQQARLSAAAIFANAFASNDSLTRIAALDAFLENRSWFELDNNQYKMRKRIASTSLEFGLPNLAFSLLDKNAVDADKDFLLDKAFSALADGMADEAIEVAAPFSEDAKFGETIVKANIQKGQFHAALAAAATLNDEGLRAAMIARAGWLARAWNSAASGFQNLDPNLLSEDAALQYALAAYMSGKKALPPAVEAVFSKQRPSLIDGARSLFAAQPSGSALEKSQRLVESATQEILMYQEIMSDG